MMTSRCVAFGLPLGYLASLLLITCNYSRMATTSAFSMGSWNKVTNTGLAGRAATVVWTDPATCRRDRCMSYGSRSSRSSSRSSTGMSMVIDRMSDNCISAIRTSHDLGNMLGMQTLKNEVMMAGIVGHPERAGRTLAKYGIVYQAVKQSAVQAVQGSGDPLVPGGNEEPKALPFSSEARETLTAATKIADNFESKAVRSEHLLLALMGYNYGNEISAESEQGDVGLNILLETEGLIAAERFSSYDFCEELVADIKRQPPSDGEDVTVVEQVVIGGPSGGSSATLDKVGVDLTKMALEGKLDICYGRDNEIRMALRTLGRRRKNNPCLIGDPGVGKTAIAEAIAQVLASSYATEDEKPGFEVPEVKLPEFKNPFRKNKDKDKDKNKDKEEEMVRATTTEEMEEVYTLPKCPDALAGYRLISIELASLVAGTQNRGDFEEKVQKLIDETKNSNVILFIDEIHNLIGTGGGGDGAMNAANLMKPALARGELRLLGSTTTSEYRKYIEKDGALERRFQPLTVREPTVDETLDILGAVLPKYEEYHGVEYTNNALVTAAKLSDRYISDRFLPDKAIDVLDEAGSMIKMSDDEENFYVTEDAITSVISELSGIPVGSLDTGEKARLRNLELEMGKRIKGQERAIKAVAKSIRRARAGMRDGKRPVASFMFCGPTGVGKTEVCKALAETYFGQEKDMIRIDMSEYMDRFSTSRLVGAPPGYVGYDEGGQLTEAVRRAPHSVVLFDEVEKAHEDVLNILLQVMDEGTLTDGKGRTVSFKNTVFVMTSNIGSQRILDMSKQSSGDNLQQTEDVAEVVKEELESTMKPELLNRIDEIVVFSPLSYDNLRDIASNILDATAKRVADDQDIKMTISDSVVKMVTREGLQSAAQFGARPIRRAAQRYLEDTMSEAIMREFVDEGDTVIVEMDNEKEMIVKITNVGKKQSILIPVEDNAGIGSTPNGLEWQALNGALPSLDDPPKPESDGFQ